MLNTHEEWDFNLVWVELHENLNSLFVKLCCLVRTQCDGADFPVITCIKSYNSHIKKNQVKYLQYFIPLTRTQRKQLTQTLELISIVSSVFQSRLCVFLEPCGLHCFRHVFQPIHVLLWLSEAESATRKWLWLIWVPHFMYFHDTSQSQISWHTSCTFACCL